MHTLSIPRGLALLLVGAALGCSKGDAPSGASSAAPGASSAASAPASPTAACAETLATLLSADPKIGPTVKGTLRTGLQPACAGLSPKAQACLAGAKTDKEVDPCLKDEPKASQDAFEAALMKTMKSLAPPTSAPAAPKPVTLDKLKLVLDVPGDSKADAAPTMGKNAFFITSTETTGLNVREDRSAPRDLKAAEKKVKAMFSKSSAFAGDTLPDGFFYTFKDGVFTPPMSSFAVYKKIGKTTFVCDGTAADPTMAALSLAACKTLRGS